MKKIGKFIVGLSMAALMSLGLAACQPTDSSISGSGNSNTGSNNTASSKPDSSKPDSSKPDSSKPDSSKPDSSKPDSSKPEEIPEDTGTLKDNIFEAESAEYTGVSSNNGNNFGHACEGKSYVFDTSFSGNLSIRNVSPKNDDAATANNKIAFKFTSDKAVKVKMEISVASRFDNGNWVAMNFSEMYRTVINGTELTETVEVPAATAADKVQNNNYTCMKKIELPITLQKGENVIEFNALAKSCNLDYINVKTSATLTGWVDHFWMKDVVTIKKAPTLEATGTITFGCSEGTDGHTQDWTMPKLNADDYDVTETDTQTVYSLTVHGETYTFAVDKAK